MKSTMLIAAMVGIPFVAGAAYTFRAEANSVLGSIPSLFGRPSSQDGAPLPFGRYRTVAVQRGDVRQTVTATGTLNALVTVEVGTQLSGQLAKVMADFTEHVSKGQALAELDRRSFEARLAEAQAATAMAETLVEVQKSKIERARVDLFEAKSRTQVLQAKAESARARKQAAESALARVQALHGRGVSSPSQLDDAQAERDATAANLREAEAVSAANIYTIAGAGADLRRAEAELANALAGVPQKRAVQLLAEIELERTVIRSPIDGVVVGRNFSEGQTVAASLEAPTLFMIAGDLTQMDIYARVDESDIGKIKVGQRATFTVDAQPGRQFEADVVAVRQAPQQQQPGGSLRRTMPQTQSNVVTYTVVLRTNNKDTLLLPGMTAVIRIIVDEANDALTVPMAAFRFTPNGDRTAEASRAAQGPNTETVWTWSGSGLKPILVQVRTANGVQAAIATGEAALGLKEGDQVVVAEAVESAPQRSTYGIKLGF
jgi:HlyD family secretion protein